MPRKKSKPKPKTAVKKQVTFKKSKKPVESKPPKNKTSLPISILFYRAILVVSLLLLLLILPSPEASVVPVSIAQNPEPTPIPTPEPTIRPVATTTLLPPLLSAKGVYVLDPKTETVLFAHNPDLPLMPASTTKIMTALVALETYDLDDVITISEEERTIGQTMNLVRGEQITVRDLLYGTLVSSANDGALALALAYPQNGYSGFVHKMNQKAKELGLLQTQYKNVSGVESVGHVTSARDLAILAAHALENPTFREMVGTKKHTVTDITGSIVHPLYSTNQLLGVVEGMQGIKTGWTENAKECLVTYTTRDGREVITVVLGSNDRFGESARLIEWVYQNHSWELPQATDSARLTER